MKTSDRAGSGDLDMRKIASMLIEGLRKQALRFQRHGVDNDAAILRKRLPCNIEHARVGAAATKIASAGQGPQDLQARAP